jgi:hypothetical protein
MRKKHFPYLEIFCQKLYILYMYNKYFAYEF